jgi:hypothetical protein
MVAASPAVFAEEASEPASAAQEQEQAQPVLDDQEPERPQPPQTRLKVLEDPYQIASFYRSSQVATTRSYFDGYPIDAPAAYPIAGFYRSGSEGRHGRFWSNGGHDAGRWGQFWVVSTGHGSHRRAVRVGVHPFGASDLCMAAPTFLFPFAHFVNELH